MTLWEQFSANKTVFPHGVRCSHQILESPLIFVEQGVKFNTDRYINDIFVPAFEEMKNTLKISLSPSNKMEHYPTPPEKLRTGANVIFQDSGSPDLNPMDFWV